MLDSLSDVLQIDYSLHMYLYRAYHDDLCRLLTPSERSLSTRLGQYLIVWHERNHMYHAWAHMSTILDRQKSAQAQRYMSRALSRRSGVMGGLIHSRSFSAVPLRIPIRSAVPTTKCPESVEPHLTCRNGS